MAGPQIEIIGEKTPVTSKTTEKSTPAADSTKSSVEKIVAGGGDSLRSPKSSPDVSDGGSGDKITADKASSSNDGDGKAPAELHVKWLEVKKIVIDYTTPATDGVANASALDSNAPLELPPVELFPSIPAPQKSASNAADASKLPTKEVTKKSDNLKLEGKILH